MQYNVLTTKAVTESKLIFPTKKQRINPTRTTLIPTVGRNINSRKFNNMNWETYISIGDSITKGARTYLSYPEKIASGLKSNLNKEWNLINISENGHTVIDVLRLIDKKYNFITNQLSGISTILIGTNDAKNNTSVQDFRIAYDLLVLKAKLFTQKGNVILIEIPNFPKGIMYPYKIQMNDTIDLYNKIIKEIAQDHGLRTFRFKLDQSDFYDGVHLNEQGVDTCSSQLIEFILKDKGL
jgi:lysophospholipase L1-like esterase